MTPCREGLVRLPPRVSSGVKKGATTQWIANKVISTLNGLIETLKDGENGFKTAAEGLQDPQVKSLFQQVLAAARRHGARAAGRGPPASAAIPKAPAAFAGAAHRGWINIKSVVTGKDDGSIIAEAERGEDSAKKPTKKRCARRSAAQTLALVREQSMKIHDAHDRVRSLESAVTGAGLQIVDCRLKIDNVI